MLTFDFTGVSGEMTVRERLTSGMVGKQVQINLSEEWADLTKTAVFIAGDICRVAELTEATVVIPSDVLRHPFRKLLVGVSGTNEDGTLVIPTILAEGPFVECGAEPASDPTAYTLPVWQNLQNQIGSLDNLSTAVKTSLVEAINELAAGMLDGLSMFYTQSEFSSTSSVISIKKNLVKTGGRTLQKGDFILSSNGSLALVDDVGAADVLCSGLMSLKGHTPVRGTDYWTEADIAEIKSYVDEAILGGAW